MDGSVPIGPPKSAAGTRTVALPKVVIFELRVHLNTHAGDGDEAFVVLGAKEAMLRRPVFFPRGSLFPACAEAVECAVSLPLAEPQA